MRLKCNAIMLRRLGSFLVVVVVVIFVHFQFIFLYFHCSSSCLFPHMNISVPFIHIMLFAESANLFIAMHVFVCVCMYVYFFSMTEKSSASTQMSCGLHKNYHINSIFTCFELKKQNMTAFRDRIPLQSFPLKIQGA